MSGIPIYDKEEVRAAADCTEILAHYGYQVKRDRCAAEWRGGTNPESVSIKGNEWYDHGAEEGGDCFDLLALLDPQYKMFPNAVRFLGDRFGCSPTRYLTPSPAKGPSRYDELIEEGFHEAARYDYTDEEGELVQQVVRLEHEKRAKQFLQCDARGRWSIKHVQPVLYNLPGLADSSWACVVEGEKDADTLITWGIPATTNAGGAKRWEDSFSDALAGKDIILLPDNDPVGIMHLNLVGKSLQGKARSIRVLVLSKAEKGDVTDWRDREGGSKEAFLNLMKQAPAWIEPRHDDIALAEAKEANQKPFRNYLPEKLQEGNRTKIVKRPRVIGELVKEAHLRFLGFPRRIGGSLFDHDLETDEIIYLDRTSGLFSWMGLKANNHVVWTRGDEFTTKEEFFAGMLAQARSYESISKVPDWPRRDDVYYSHPELPDPDPGHKHFKGLISFFKPASDEYRILLKALFTAPIFYRPGIPCPLWILDSDDGAGVGKTTVAEAVSFLYDCPPVSVSKNTMKQGFDDVIKRLVSDTGRLARVFLLDNVTGNFRSDELSSLITQGAITGRAAYGRGEVSRPNNLTYVITANSASIDNDIAVRAFFIFLRRSNVNATWKQALWDYIRRWRLYIFADIIDMLSNHEPFQAQPRTRFPEFEMQILAPYCEDESQLGRVLDAMDSVREEANKEEEIAHHIREIIVDKLIEIGVESPFKRRVFIQSAIIESWLKNQIAELPSITVQMVRNMAKNGILDGFNAKVRKYPHNGSNRRAGIMWEPCSNSENPLPSVIVSGVPNKPNVEIG